MNQVELLIIGGLISIVSAFIIQWIVHIFSSRRDDKNWLREEFRQKRERLEQKLEKGEIEKNQLKAEIAKKEQTNLGLLIYVIMLMNQRRDMLLGFSQEEQNSRGKALEGILRKLSQDELEAIVREEKPLPKLPGKPRSLS